MATQKRPRSTSRSRTASGKGALEQAVPVEPELGPGPESERAKASQLRDAVIAWFRRGHRDLPWRRTRDPYAVWVSEIMLQQTRVDTVAPRFERWMARFPSVGALSAASLDDVLGEWAGLGYYARARNLHAAARQIEERYGGRFPDTEEGVSSLPGIGRYTTGAILSIAYGQPVPILDGNVERVLSRVFRVEGDPGQAKVKARLWALAAEVARARPDAAVHTRGAAVQYDIAAAQQSAAASQQSPPDPSALNQGLMELGATVCAPRGPSCLVCPAVSLCEAGRAGEAERYPAPSKPTRVLSLDHVAIALVRGGEVLLARRPPTGLWGGLWELPTVELLPGEAGEAAARRAAVDRVGIEVSSVSPLPGRDGAFVHVLSHRRIRFVGFRAEAPRGARGAPRPSGYDAAAWVAFDAAGGMGLSRATGRLLGALAAMDRGE